MTHSESRTGERAGRILVVDDDQALCEALADGLAACGFEVIWRLTADAVVEAMEKTDIDAVLTDLYLGSASGLEVCERVLARGTDVGVVVMTAFGSLESAVGAIRAGAYDYVTKPLSMKELALTIGRAVQRRRMLLERARLREKVEFEDARGLVGDSPAMRELADFVDRVASSDASVLVTGESGTGKELIAKQIHANSGRKGQFLAINCAAVPESLLESELFGHERGAFTDARAARKGLFVEAEGGTLFLDEIAEMPVSMQTKLLRALQERKVRPVGSSAESSFDARIVTATNRDIEAEVLAQRFREDLYYRINVVRIEVPPLRARGNDVLRLAQYFLARSAARSQKPVCRIGDAVAERIMSYRWPGNVRELENCIERAVALATYDEITLEDLPTRIRERRMSSVLPSAVDDPMDMPNMQTVEYRYMLTVLERVKGNKTLAAKILGFDRRTLYRKLAAAPSPAQTEPSPPGEWNDIGKAT